MEDSMPTNREIIAAWDGAADHLDGWTDEGDFTRKYLLNPALFELLGDVNGLRVLDAGCGQGYLARLLARRGARVTGIEPARRLYDLCRDYERDEPLGITYMRQDLSAPEPGLGVFDRVICNMMLMDIPEWEAAIATAAAAVAPAGRLIVSILHPCFEEPMSQWPTTRQITVKEYLDTTVRPQTIGQFFHRPLSAYINRILETGLILTRVIEPQLIDAEALAINDRDAHVPTYIVLRADRTAA